MTVNTGGNNEGTLASAFAAAGISKESVREPQPAQAASATQTQPNVQRQRGPMAAGFLRKGPLSRNANGAVLTSLSKSFNKVFEENLDPEMRAMFQLVPMDKSSSLTRLSNLLVTLQTAFEGKTYVTVFTLISEASGNTPSAKQINYGSRVVEVEQVAGDLADSFLWEKIEDLLRARNGQSASIINAGALVVPTEFNAEDEQLCYNLAFKITQAIYTVFDKRVVKGEPITNINDIREAMRQLVVRVAYADQMRTNSTGLPVRSDLSISLRGALKGQVAQNTAHEQEIDLTRVDGFIDFVYVEPNQQAQPYGAAPAPQRYAPRYVITGMDTEQDSLTLEQQLLALSTTFGLSQNRAWAGVLREKTIIGGRNVRDIGAIGLELTAITDGKRIDTKEMSESALGDLVQTAFHDTFIYSIDVPEADENTWINQVYIKAAEGDQGSNDALLTAADNLTNGQMRNFWKNTAEPILFNDETRIPLGYFMSDAGRQDGRRLDYLAVLNLQGESDPTVLYKWAACFEPSQSATPEMRTEEMLRLIRQMVPGFVLKGYAQRKTFNPRFIEALSMAVEAAGLVAQPQGVVSLFGTTQGRGQFDLSRFGVSGSNVGHFIRQTNNDWGSRNTSTGSYFGSLVR